MSIAYRPEIDGLRAIAVLAVVLYHAGIGGAGFVGVDIFFVISGYLITSLLLKEQSATGRIDILAFYARRVRRILPAASVVVLATLAAGWFLLPLQAQIHTADSAGAALVFASNIFFQLTTGGYFDPSAEEIPLLHLWTLSVEEQFYLLWPALLILLLRFHRPLLAAGIGALGLVSFASAELLIAAGSDAAFYQMPPRFWELAAGGLIAALPERALPRWLATAGILITLVACIWPFAHFPGVGALPAVLGASLLIGAIHGGARSPVLSSAPMVGIGLISYSLYLWHWPLLAFYRATSIGEGSVQTRLALCALAVLLALASYRYVEQPFRRLRIPGLRLVVSGSAVSTLLALGAYGLGLHLDKAMKSHATATAIEDNPLAVHAENDWPSRHCHASRTDPPELKCAASSRTVVWGDSMGYAWMPAFPEASQATRDNCQPFVGYLPAEPKPTDLKCLSHNAAAARLPGDTFILAARWAAVSHDFDLAPTFEALKGRKVLVIGPSPQMRERVPRCIRQRAERECAITRAEFDAQAKPLLAKLRKAAAPYANVEIVDVSDYFCSETSCPPVRDGVPMYWDANHVSATAASAFKLRDFIVNGARPTTSSVSQP